MNNKTQQEIPAELERQLASARLKYSSAVDVFHCINIGGDSVLGVFGDGSNGAYEWFVWDKGTLTHSNDGFGSTVAALRTVLVAEANAY